MTFMISGVPERAQEMVCDTPHPRPLPTKAQIILDALIEAGHPLKAYDLFERLKDRGISAPMTVYRALERLIADGLVRKIESQNSFVALCRTLYPSPVVFEICRHCHQTRVVELDQTALAALKALGLNTDKMYIETSGNCQGCDEHSHRTVK